MNTEAKQLERAAAIDAAIDEYENINGRGYASNLKQSICCRT